MPALTVAALAATWLVLAGVVWFVSHLLRQNGRLFQRIDELERELNDLHIATGTRPQVRPFGDRSLARSKINRDGLKPGTVAPDFTLPTIDGGELTLRNFEGRRVLIVFSDPECAPCMALAPRLQELSRTAADKVQVLMVSRGDRDANRRKVDEHGLRFPVVLQKHWEVSRAYGKFVTPMAYLIDERGVITAPVAVGTDAILALLPDAAPQPAAAASEVQHGRVVR